MQKILLTIDKISTFAGQTFSWLIVAHLSHHLRGVRPLRPRVRPFLGLRHHAPDVRDPLHDGRRLHPLEERHGPRRRPLRFLTEASAGHIRPDALHPLLPARGDRPLLGRLCLCRRFLADFRAFEHHRRRPAALPFKTIIPIAGAFITRAGHRRNRPLRHVPQAG